ncbi:Uncharacterized protein TPAR_02012 [Tolypocladium paradoxum]|uniref:Peroxisomal membrane protein PEX14 n=1 Tax=Tolypocladium paradoxum TaxID=94208 RepID=A0A2S4L5U4_9HYPO|nr:Uncharacterized protein TPAR_02012 [Tolypocladium paradoxum]
MGDSQDKPASAGIPACQQRSEQDGAETTGAQPPDQLELARRFLDDDEVKTASRDKKVEFLKTKGVEDGDIQKLLGDSETVPGPPEVRLAPTLKKHDEKPNTDETPTQQEATHASTLPATGSDRPPIVTYPEFLARPQRPPPLVTTNGLLTTLYGFAGLSTLLYGTSRFVIGPMVESLTDARSDLYGTSSKKLDALVAKLEKTVSEIPPGVKAQPATVDDASDAEDPTEMFHRDIGTQTSLPATPDAAAPSSKAAAAAAAESESKRQADRLSTLTKTLSGLKDQFRTQSEDMDDIRTLLDVFRDDLDGMTYGGQTQFVGGYDVYGGAKKTEPEDEIRKVRDNIRRVKGVLLSTRSFPASTR